MIRFELKKILNNKFFICTLVFSLLLNIFILYKAPRRESSDLKYEKYEDFLNSVRENAETALSASVFSNNMSDFSRRNIEKTANDFEKMKNIEIKNDTNLGIYLLFNSDSQDFCILLLLISLGMSLIVPEKERHLFSLVRSTKNGTEKTIFSKLGALFICSFFINLILTLSTAVYAFCVYGFGDISRSVQSIPEMTSSFLRLNIGEYLLMLFLSKTVGIFTVAVIVLLCFLVSGQAVTALLSVSIVSAVNVGLTFIPETSSVNHVKYINLCSLLNPHAIFRSYLNLNIFGKPVNVIIVFAVFFVVTTLAAVFSCAVYFVKKRPLENSKRKTTRSQSAQRIHSSLMYFELKKLLILNKSSAIIVILALFQIFAIYNQTNFQSSADYTYKYYIEKLRGPLTEEKESFILSEKAKIDSAQSKLNELNENRRNIPLSEFAALSEQYSKILENSDAVDKIYERYLYIKETNGAEFIYDAGYEKLFGITNHDFSLESAVVLLTVFSLCFSSVQSQEYKNGTYKLLLASKLGGKELRKAKFKASVCALIPIFTLSYLPEFIFIARFYGFEDLFAPLRSIPSLSYFGSLPVLSYIILLTLLRFTLCLALLPIISAISKKLKNSVFTSLAFFIMSAMPLLLCKSGLSLLRPLTLLPLLSGEIFLNI